MKSIYCSLALSIGLVSLHTFSACTSIKHKIGGDSADPIPSPSNLSNNPSISTQIQSAMDSNGDMINEKEGPKGRTCLMDAVADGYVQHVKCLIQNKADVNVQDNDGLTALHIAISTSQPVIVNELIKAGAKLNLRDKHGRTALLYAVSNTYQRDACKLLIKRGVNLKVQTNMGLDMDALVAAKLVLCKNLIDIVKLLLAAKADINARNNQGATALIKAVENNAHIDVVKCLIEEGANLDIKDRSGKTARIYAKKHNRTDVIKLLIDRKHKSFCTCSN